MDEKTNNQSETNSLSENKSPFYKKVWFWILIIILIIVIGIIAFGKGNDSKNNQSTPETTKNDEVDISSMRCVDEKGFSVNCDTMNKLVANKASGYLEKDITIETDENGNNSVLINGADAFIDIFYFKDSQLVNGSEIMDCAMLVGDGQKYSAKDYVYINCALTTLTDPYVSNDYYENTIGSEAFQESLNIVQNIVNAHDSDTREIALGSKQEGYMLYSYTMWNTDICSWCTTRDDNVFYPLNKAYLNAVKQDSES